ncbi:ATP-binding cassette domain-containing protein [Cerasicoccus arenae]|uniref:ABC transporter domain-containing protein n=1 Tax=Cerasicoccus arenae TaxID=424488 RepID=A0A8J3GFH2_9BACT|nr:ATP-binding cassette domain-containing protein [Cerasicoccus arenae]MBK1857841.1 ATP-binding cassette domain-containing protein [Cerasicoccus arenae]GHC11550.1 hypothetical protein GCM10007047_31020 [Cerasicoccus arenae]
MFSFNQLSVSTDETTILQSMAGQFLPGQLNAVVGPSGCGKTTLVKSLLGLLDCKGEIAFHGKEIDPQTTSLAGRVGITVFQGVWMTIFVKVICQFPGSFLMQATILSLCCLSMTWVCLGMSAVFVSTEKASLLSIYLVGFQLPLSGVVLALPDMIVWVLRPFINAFWSWSGYLVTMKDYQVYDGYRIKDTSWLPNEWLACGVLVLQALAGLACVLYGVRRSCSR